MPAWAGGRPGLWQLDFGCGLFRFSGRPPAAWEIWESGGLSFTDPAQARRDALHVPFWRQKGTEKPPPIPTRRPHGLKGPAGPFGNPGGNIVAK